MGKGIGGVKVGEGEGRGLCHVEVLIGRLIKRIFEHVSRREKIFSHTMYCSINCCSQIIQNLFLFFIALPL
jgi:hypothetical protein